MNVGAEIRAYDYLVFGFDVFNRKTNDMKTRPPLPDYIGNDPSTANVGSMLNQGIDMEFGYDRTYSKDFAIGVSGNVSEFRGTARSAAPGTPPSPTAAPTPTTR